MMILKRARMEFGEEAYRRTVARQPSKIFSKYKKTELQEFLIASIEHTQDPQLMKSLMKFVRTAKKAALVSVVGQFAINEMDLLCDRRGAVAHQKRVNAMRSHR